MKEVKLTILGAGSAVPMKRRSQPSQVLSIRNKQFMFDCGEGTQNHLDSYAISISRLDHIFISHFHGDHCFGLLGLISTMGMKRRRNDLYIHCFPELKEILLPSLEFFCKDLSFNLHFVPFSPMESELLYEDKSLTIHSFPLVHSVPSSGFLFKEKIKDRHIIREKIDFFKIPVKQLPLIKGGADFVTEDGVVIPNSHLTTDPSPSFSYAYCSDTLYSERVINYIEGVDCLYHEATFLHEDLVRAKETLHSTALQAATIASKANVKKLILGHFSARYRNLFLFKEEAQKIFKNTMIAKDGEIFEW